MKLFTRASALSLALCSTLLLSACNKAETDTAVDSDVKADTAVVVETPAADSTASVEAPVAATASSDTASSDNAFVNLTASSMAAALILPATMESTTTPEQKTCLTGYDKNLGVKETQAFYEKNFTAAEMAELNDFYSSGTMKQMSQYTDEQMRIMAGETVASPIAAPTPEQMQAMETSMKELSVFKNMDKLKATEGDLLESIKPVINAEFKRCDMDKTI